MTVTYSPSSTALVRVGRRAGRLPVGERSAPPSPTSALVVDTLSIVAASLTVWLASAGGDAGLPLPWLAAFDATAVVLLHLRGLYRFRLQSSLFDDAGAALACTLVSVVAVITARSVLAPDLHAAAQTVRTWAYVTPNLLLVSMVRAVVAQRAFRRGGTSNTLIIGAGAIGRQLAHRLSERPEMGLRPIGFLDKEPLPHLENAGPPVLGASWDLEHLVARHRVETVVFTFSTAPHHVYNDLMQRSHKLGLHVLVVPRLFEQMTGRVQLAHLGGMGVLHVQPVEQRSWRFAVKYLLDRAVAGVALVALSPVMIAVALAVRCTSRGPVLFRQRRAGLDGRSFDMLKFRTMTGLPETHGEADAAWVARAGGGGSSQGPRADTTRTVADRRTPIGRLLRRTSLDELPQLINVIRGEMSLVGPRPERAALATSFGEAIPRYRDRHRVRPGVTGWAQVHHLRGATSLTDRVEWDNHYIENWTPWIDIKILLMTAAPVFKGDGTG